MDGGLNTCFNFGVCDTCLNKGHAPGLTFGAAHGLLNELNHGAVIAPSLLSDPDTGLGCADKQNAGILVLDRLLREPIRK
jgi:hypothetical protein